MIVYSATKEEFNNDVIMNQISNKILKKLQEANIHGSALTEYHAWQNSLNFMNNVLNDKDFDDQIEVAIEYQIPRTFKRIDFIIAGADKHDGNNILFSQLINFVDL